MTALPGWPAVSGAATFQHIRRALAGQVVRSDAGVLRKGILPAHTGPLVTGTSTMNVAVGPFVAVLDRNGAIFLANDGTVNVQLSSAPASGSRWSVVYVKQQETDAADAENGPIIHRVESTSSEAAARALLPAGALELAVVKVDAGSATTNAVGVTITQTHPYTAMAGGVVLVRSSSERDGWSPGPGAECFQLDVGDKYVRAGGQWVRSWTSVAPTVLAAASGWVANSGQGFAPTITATNDIVSVYGGLYMNGAAPFSEAFVAPSWARVVRTTTVPYIGYTGTPESPTYVQSTATIFTSGSVTLSHNLHPRSQITWSRR